LTPHVDKPKEMEYQLAGRGIELDELTAMRVSFWLAGLARAGGCAVSELVDLPVLADISSLEFQLYTLGRRKPSQATLNSVEAALPGTRARYDRGPDGTNLWGILEGAREACQGHLDSELARTRFTPISAPRFKEKVIYIWLSLLPEYLHYWKSAGELMADSRSNIFAETYRVGLKQNTAENRAKTVPYTASLVTTVIALWQLFPHYPESEAGPMCRYLLEGVLDLAVQEELPEEIGVKVAAYLRRKLESC
jgi:hypothetical protein